MSRGCIAIESTVFELPAVKNKGRGKPRAWSAETTVERHNQSWPTLARSRPEWHKWDGKV